MGWAALLKSAGSKAAQESGKKIAEKITKKVNEKKSKVKGKDIAKKMLGGGGESSGGGGALAIRPSTSIVSSPAGGLASSSKGGEGGDVVSKSSAANELGLNSFMDSVVEVKVTTDSIRGLLSDSSKDSKKRIEKQRLLNARLKKEEREEALEGKKPGAGIGKKILSPIQKMGASFLEKLKRFFTNMLLGVLINGIMGGQRDVVVAFLAGYKAYRMAKEAAVKFVFKIGSKIKGGLKGAAGKLANSGKNIFKTLVKVGIRLKEWIIKGVKVATKVISEGIKRTPQVVRTVQNVMQRVKPVQRLQEGVKTLNKLRKTPITETLKTIQNSQLGQRVGGVLNRGKNIWKNFKPGGAGWKNLKPGGGGGLWKNIRNLGSQTVKNIRTSGVGQLVGNKWSQIGNWAKGVQNKMLSGLDEMVKGGVKTAQGWNLGKKLAKLKKLASNPKELMKVVKKALDSKIAKVLDKNKMIKDIRKLKNMKPKEIATAVGKFLKNLGKNKNFLKVKSGLTKARSLKIGGLDAVLAALLGLFDYAVAGESPINALLRASGSLIGYTMGAAAGVPIPIPGASFVTGMAGAWAGEKFADGLSAVLAETELGKTPDTAMNDGRMWVRNPFSDKATADRAAGDESSMANLGEIPKDNTAEEISESASYEDGAVEEDTTVIVGGGEETASTSSTSQGRDVKFIPLDEGGSEKTLDTLSNATLYKA